MIPGAISSTSGVGDMKIRINTFGSAIVTTVQKILNTATVPSVYFNVSRILSPLPAPKLVEMIGWEACPTL